jgi:hypothetical protein
MTTNFKDSEKLFKKFESPEVAVVEGNAVDFERLTGYQHIRNVTLFDKECKVHMLYRTLCHEECKWN